MRIQWRDALSGRNASSPDDAGTEVVVDLRPSASNYLRTLRIQPLASERRHSECMELLEVWNAMF